MGESRWCVFPSKETTPITPKGNSVTVRPGLDVVLPHPDIVTELVGSDLMSALQSPSPSADSAGLVIRRLDDILGRQRDAAAGAAAGKCAHALWVELHDALVQRVWAELAGCFHYLMHSLPLPVACV